MNLCKILAILLLFCAGHLFAQKSPADHVHPLVGTAHEGQTYPATGVPFAMTHWTPQTRAGEIKCVAPYYYADKTTQGFRGSHFLSGSCVPDYGTMTLMPSAAALKTSAVDRASRFDRSSEHASPYLYQVDLKDARVHAEVTGTTHAGMMRFTFLGKDASVVVENNARGGDGWVRIDRATREVLGEVPVRREYAGSGRLAGFSGFFVLQFSKPFLGGGTWVGQRSREGASMQRGDGEAAGVVSATGALTTTRPVAGTTASTRPGFGVYLRFPGQQAGEKIVVRIGTSFVSLEEARRNLGAEIPNWDFDAVALSAKQAWDHDLSRIEVKDNNPATDIFYTAMYHALLHPRTFSDVDGSYPRFDRHGEVDHAAGFVYYDDFSMWDTFRAQLPLITLLDPARDVDMIRSLILKGQQGGFLPIFPAWNSYTSEMVGDHSTVAILDAYRKGLRGFDIAQAYELMRKNATTAATRKEANDGKGRRGLESYLQNGFIPLEDHMPEAFHLDEQVSRTLEYAYDDAMLGELAADLGKTDDAAIFRKRGENWRKVLDPTTGLARGRHSDGSWVEPFDPAQKQSWITEGLPWQYTFFVPQDVPGLIEFEGGTMPFTAKLDSLFSQGLYDHGNEPGEHIPYLYDASNAPYKSQRCIRTLMDREYQDAPGGLAGNDDAGQISAWYVLSALGFYQVTPGRPEYWIGSPRFDDVRLHLSNGKLVEITAPGAAKGNGEVISVFWNGRKLKGWTLSHQDIVSGGRLTFQMKIVNSKAGRTTLPRERSPCNEANRRPVNQLARPKHRNSKEDRPGAYWPEPFPSTL